MTMRVLLCGILMATVGLVSCAGAPKARFEKTRGGEGLAWYKGNTHTHTIKSDGDSEPEVVARWYKDRKYDFLFITDHNILTDPHSLGVEDDKFLMIPAEEVSSTFRSATMDKASPIHVNALDTKTVVAKVEGSESVAKTVQDTIDNINAAGAIPHLNHPNFRWAISHMDLMKITNYQLLEIMNGHPQVNNMGDETRPGMEKVWDMLLSDGQRIYGIGCDDAHHFTGEFKPERSNPGRAWIVVRAASLEREEILKNILIGNYYFSTGVVLDDVEVEGGNYTVAVDESAGYDHVEFIGRDGAILQTSTGNPVKYRLKGDEMYVRAKVFGRDGSAAWTQPHWIE